MKKLKSLSDFLNENQELGNVQSSKIIGGKLPANLPHSVTITNTNTTNEWTCGDTRTTAVGDGYFISEITCLDTE